MALLVKKLVEKLFSCDRQYYLLVASLDILGPLAFSTFVKKKPILYSY